MSDDDEGPCTDCGDTGITHQTERRCACQPPMTHVYQSMGLAERIANSEAVLSVYAAPEFDELNDDGKAWIAAIVAETIRRARSEPTGIDDRQITSNPVVDQKQGFVNSKPTGDYGE